MNQVSAIHQVPKKQEGPLQGAERRHARRVKMAVPARVRPYHENAELAEELLMAKNLSRDGFYFVTRRSAYRTDMHLYAACPAGNSAVEADSARVVRVDQLGGDAWGVAVSFLRSTRLYRAYGNFIAEVKD